MIMFEACVWRRLMPQFGRQRAVEKRSPK